MFVTMYHVSSIMDLKVTFDLSGPVALSTPCKLISPGAVVNGTMSITKSELYFEMDEDDALNKTIDPKVGLNIILLHTQDVSIQEHLF